MDSSSFELGCKYLQEHHENIIKNDVVDWYLRVGSGGNWRRCCIDREFPYWGVYSTSHSALLKAVQNPSTSVAKTHRLWFLQNKDKKEGGEGIILGVATYTHFTKRILSDLDNGWEEHTPGAKNIWDIELHFKDLYYIENQLVVKPNLAISFPCVNATTNHTRHSVNLCDLYKNITEC